MTYTLVTFTVEDLEKWKVVFEEAGEMRKKYGSRGVRALSKADNPNEVMIFGEYEDRTKALEMFQSQEFREATKRAGVSSQPTVIFLNEVVQLPA